MEVVNSRAALLSNHEVLKLLKELDAEHLSRAKASLRVKKDEEPVAGPTLPEASENLRTVEVEAINYLQADYLPVASQSEESITKLVKALGAFELTKAEKLQIVNLAPTTAVELYVIVEELEDRFGDKIDDILDVVKTFIGGTPAGDSAEGAARVNGINGHAADASSTMIVDEAPGWDEDADAVYDDDVYDDAGEGAGVEGDLDMEDD